MIKIIVDLVRCLIWVSTSDLNIVHNMLNTSLTTMLKKPVLLFMNKWSIQIAQNDAIQQRESAHHQPEDTGQEQELQSQDDFHVDQSDER